MSLKAVAFSIVLTLSCSMLAQSAPDPQCSDADRRAAKAFVHQFIIGLRGDGMQGVRKRYLVSTCQPLLMGYLDFDRDLGTLDCATLQSSGEALFEFMFLTVELTMASEKEPPQSDDDASFSLTLLPPEIAMAIEKRPALRRAFVDSFKVTSLAQLHQLVIDLRDASTLARRYLSNHPETVALATLRWKDFEEDVQPPTDCSVCDDPQILGIPKGTPFISTSESFFAFILIRDKGSLRIARIFPLG